MRTLGYVVVEWNQASHRPDVMPYSFSDDLECARDLVRDEQAKTAAVGRRERYTICEVVEMDDSHA